MIELIFVLTFPFFILLNGYTLSKLFEWFFVPYFHIQKISISLAIGFMLAINFVFKEIKLDKDFDFPEDKKQEKIIKYIIIVAIRPFLALIFGYFLQKYI